MTLSVKQNEPSHPHHVDTLCGEAVVANTERFPNPFEQPLLSHLDFPAPYRASFVDIHMKIREKLPLYEVGYLRTNVTDSGLRVPAMRESSEKFQKDATL
jgi:hypothetical protein